MEKRFFCVLCWATAAVFANNTAYAGPNDNWLPRANPEEVGMSSKRLERLNEMVQRHIDDELLAGAVTLVARNGKVIHFEAHGDNWREENQPMTTDAIFVIMSMTKPIVSVALMMLYEEGLFLLDDPISKWLPEFADKKVLVEGKHGFERVRAERPITIRHVLTHTAGVDPNRDLLTNEERNLLRREETLAETYKNALPSH
jgi:CubicO group peptidase (beta-lactamase class C family)